MLLHQELAVRTALAFLLRQSSEFVRIGWRRRESKFSDAGKEGRYFSDDHMIFLFYYYL